MAERRKALILASYDYDDPDISKLIAPSRDADNLARILEDPVVGGFEVQKLINKPSQIIREAVEEFFFDSNRDDLLLLYFSGHGMKDEDGRLHFVTKNTKRKRLRSTAVSAQFIKEAMQSSRSRKQVLLIDCCYSGAFARGLLAKADSHICVSEELKGEGTIILTASDSMQYSFEGDDVKGTGASSIFTRSLVDGLEGGKADEDADGSITIDELFAYVKDRVRDENPQQTPTWSAVGVKGDIVIANNPHPVVKLADLPIELRQAMESPLASARFAVVSELEHLLLGTHRGLAIAARMALKNLVEDDSRKVSDAAEKVLEAYKSEEAVSIKSELIELKETLAIEEGEANEITKEDLELEQVKNAEPKPKHKNCPLCGAKLTIEARFCPKCGKFLEDQQGPQIMQICPKCKSPIEPGSLYCGKCGQNLKGRCPNCGSKYKEGALFCGNCGNPL